jgi:PAS domain-containing protein
MPFTAQASARIVDLRQRATAQLKGPAAAEKAHAQAANALSVLMAWAASSDTAADALTLLHELQVHQVELDLQAEELRDSRAELEAVLRRHVERYDRQPAACFTLDANLLVQDLNLAGAAMLGLAQHEAFGLGLDEFCPLDSALRLRELVAESLRAEPPAAMRLELGPKGAAPKPCWAQLSMDATGKQCFLVLAPAH